jgi:hypothetical protein
MLESIAGNVLGNAAYDAAKSPGLPGDENTESERELLASIHRLLEKLVSATLAQQEPRSTWFEEQITLQANIESDYNPDARRLGYTQIAIYSPVVANLVLRRVGIVDINVALPAGRFTTIQQPQGIRWLLKAGDPTATFTVRYSDIVFGSVLP